MLQSLDRIVPQRYRAWALCAILSGTCLMLPAFSTLWLRPAPRRWSSPTTPARPKFQSAGHGAEPARIKNALNPRC